MLKIYANKENSKHEYLSKKELLTLKHKIQL